MTWFTTTSSAQWWLATLGRTIVWARLRVREAGTAEVFDSDGNTLAYDSEDTARAALMDAEFVAFDGLDASDAADRGFELDEVQPPRRRQRRSPARADGPVARRAPLTARDMYLPRAFAETDLAALDALMARDNFITLVTVARRRADGQPPSGAVPARRRHRRTARPLGAANPQSRMPALRWPSCMVRTLTCRRRGIPTRSRPLACRRGITRWRTCTATLRRFERRSRLGVLVGDADAGTRIARRSRLALRPRGGKTSAAQLSGIVGFRLAVTGVELKFKLNQNHPRANRDRGGARDSTRRSAKRAARSLH